MEIVVLLPLLIGIVAVGRVVYLKGWQGLMNADLRPNVPRSVKIGLVSFLLIELAAGLMMQAKVIEPGMAKYVLSPVLGSIVLSAFCGWLLAINWGQKDTVKS